MKLLDVDLPTKRQTGSGQMSGRGKPPKWLAAEMAKGRTRGDFLVG